MQDLKRGMKLLTSEMMGAARQAAAVEAVDTKKMSEITARPRPTARLIATCLTRQSTTDRVTTTMSLAARRPPGPRAAEGMEVNLSVCVTNPRRATPDAMIPHVIVGLNRSQMTAVVALRPEPDTRKESANTTIVGHRRKTRPARRPEEPGLRALGINPEVKGSTRQSPVTPLCTAATFDRSRALNRASRTIPYSTTKSR
jgi:hypothetical protein